MARKFLSSIDFGWLEALKFRFQNLASDPSSPAKGWVYMHSSDNRPKVHDGTSFRGLVYTDEVGATYTDENARDALATALTAGTGITITPNDGADTITVATTITQYTDELAQDTVGGALTDSTTIDFTYNDGAGTMTAAFVPTADVSMASHKLTNVTDPTSAQDAATKAYVDAVATGLDVKKSVRAASTTNVTLASAVENGDTFGGVTLATGDRVGLFGQSSGAENGIYTVNASGAPTRATDADSSAEVTGGMFTFVEEGTNADSGWVLTNDGAITVGTTALVFAQFSGAGQITSGTGLTKSGNTLNVGAGTGITVNADDVAVDTAVVVRKYAIDIGDNSATSIAVPHSLGTKDVTFSVRQNSDDAHVECDAVSTSTSVLTLTFAVAPASSALRVVVHG